MNIGRLFPMEIYRKYIEMPTNGQSEYLLFGIDSVPLFTYGMIGITTLVIAYSTILDGGANLPEFISKDASSPLGILSSPTPSPSSPSSTSPSPSRTYNSTPLQGGIKRKNKKTRKSNK
jgi:hypothetical protein